MLLITRRESSSWSGQDLCRLPSMDADKLVPKLSSSNYNTWRMQMHMLLTHKDLEYTIGEEERKTEDLLKRSDEDKKKERTLQRKALTLISLRVEEEFMTIIEDAEESETPARKA